LADFLASQVLKLTKNIEKTLVFFLSQFNGHFFTFFQKMMHLYDLQYVFLFIKSFGQKDFFLNQNHRMWVLFLSSKAKR